MSAVDERNVDPIAEMARIALNFLDLPLRGFKESYSSNRYGQLIYDSEWCRIGLGWEGGDQIVGNSIHIRYARLHAPDENSTMKWQGEECRCWHRIEHPLHFLDGRPPADAAALDYSHPLIRSFRKAEVLQNFKRRQPEWLAHVHVAIWQQYGQRLFELFDLRQPDVWQQYRQFLREVYDIKGRDPDKTPPLDKVC